MKSLPNEENYCLDIPVQDDSFEEAEITSEVQKNKNHRPSPLRNRPSIVNNESQNSSESDSLIVCNADLAASFRSIKADKLKLTPGHYLQKVFLNSVAQKFRSQSLPNCFDKKKHKCSSGVLDEGNETSAPLVEAKTEFVSADVEITESSDLWFKTWPERNNDKVPNHKDENHTSVDTSHHDVLDSGLDRNLFSLGDKCDIQEGINREQSSNLHKSDLESHNNVKPNSANLGVGSAKFRKYDHIESCLHKLDNKESLKSENGHYEPNKNLFSNTQVEIQNSKSIPLDDLLDNFPLAYSPLTKQLLLVQPHHKDISKAYSNNVKDKPSPTVLNGGRSICDVNSSVKVLNLEETISDKFGGGKGCTTNQGATESDLATSAAIAHRLSTDVSSFSSTVSSLSDNSPSTNEDSALGSLLDHGDTCSLVSVGGSSAFSEESVGAKPKKKGLTGFFSKNVFNWRSGSRSEDSITRSGPSWKLFGKNSSPQSSLSSLTVDHYTESDAWSLAPDSPSSVRSGGGSSTPRTFTHESRVASSSALIQLDRPANLPAKSEEEESRHRLEYQQMVEAARKKELKEAKQRKKQAQLQLRAEEQLAQATRVWTREILPRWEQMSTSKKTRELWWQGVPPCVRGKVWKLAIGNPLNLTHSLYDICVQRAQDRLRSGGTSSDDEDSDNKEASMQLIQLDISRTFPHLCIFQKGGPYYDMLHCLLAAYVCYRPDVGYVQGMSFIAAVLILNMEAPDAFVSFANLLNSPCHMAFFHLNQPLMQAYYSTYNELLKENLPQLYDHFTTTTLTPDLYLLDWIYTVFTKAMNLDLASRVWDVFLRDGDQFLFQTALGVLHLCQDTLLQMDFVHGSQFLTRLPDDLCGDQLFKSISCIKMTVGKQKFEDILATHSVDCN